MSNFSVALGLFAVALVLGLVQCQSGPKPGYCHHNGLYVKEGEADSAKGICAHIRCRDAATNDFALQSCGLIAAKPGCKIIPEDETKPYPECCGQVLCDN